MCISPIVVLDLQVCGAISFFFPLQLYFLHKTCSTNRTTGTPSILGDFLNFNILASLKPVRKMFIKSLSILGGKKLLKKTSITNIFFLRIFFYYWLTFNFSLYKWLNMYNLRFEIRIKMSMYIYFEFISLIDVSFWK